MTVGWPGLIAKAEHAYAGGSECPRDSEEGKAWSLEEVVRVEEEGSSRCLLFL